MTQSIEKDRQGPDWPLGLIVNVTPGIPVNIMSLVDPAGVNGPGAATSPTSDEFTVACQQIQITAVKPGVTHGLQPNTGNIYIMRKPVQGPGNRDDYGAMVAMLFPGQSFFISSAPLNRNVLSPYRYHIDADNAGDGALVTMYIA